jgi:hypothetical protein
MKNETFITTWDQFFYPPSIDGSVVFSQSRFAVFFVSLLSVSVYLASVLHSNDFGSVRHGLVFATGRQSKYLLIDPLKPKLV